MEQMGDMDSLQGKLPKIKARPVSWGLTVGLASRKTV
jgi:hypothetical protein